MYFVQKRISMAKNWKKYKKLLDISTFIKYNFPVHYKNVTKEIIKEKET